VQVADEWDLRLNHALDCRDMHLQKMAASHPVSPLGVLIIHPPPQGHAIFGDEDRPATEISAVVIAKEAHSVRQNAPVPPFARDAIHKVTAQRFVFKFVIPPNRMSEHMCRERVVVIEPDVIQRRSAIVRIKLLD